MVTHFLSTRSILASECATSELQISSLQVGLPGDEEEFLLEADVGVDTVYLVSKMTQQTRAFTRKGI
jgi:hypothetical protein